MADTSLIESKIGLLIWKTSIFWQKNLRKILIPYKISLNEYLILQSIVNISQKKEIISQNEVANFVGINVSVTSVTLKLLEKKKYISRFTQHDTRKKTIQILKSGNEIFDIIDPLIHKQEELIFSKLNNETFNFTNSLKLLLGKKIRIKANKEI